MELSDIKDIAKSFIYATRNLLDIPNEEVEKRAAERYEICLTCDTRSGSICDKDKGGCDCPLSLRTRSNKGCIKGKW